MFRSTRVSPVLRLALPLALLTGGALIPTAQASPSAPPQAERALKDSDLSKLSKSLAEYIEARTDKEGLDEAKAEVGEQIEKLTKKLKGTAPLSCAADIGWAAWLSNEYHKQRVSKGKVQSGSYVDDKFFPGGLEYAFRVPKKYRPTGKAYPIIICLHDEAQSPEDLLKERWNYGAVTDEAVLFAPILPEEPDDWPEVLVGDHLGGIGHVMIAFKAASERFGIDYDRVYIAGRGASVPLAVAMGNYSPDRFAGIVGVSGDAGTTKPDNFSQLPTYFAGSGAEATRFADKAKELGIENVTIDPSGDEAKAWDWMSANPRSTYPEEVALVPGLGGEPTRAYWIQVGRVPGESKITARLEREKNTVHVSGSGVTDFTLLLNDSIVDLDKPVTVIANGVTHTAMIPRSLNTTLDMLFYARCDPMRMIVATHDYQLPARAAEGEEGE